MKPAEHALVVAHHWFGDVIGGSFRLATEFAQYLASQGLHVTYICCAARGSPAKSDRDASGVYVRRYPQPKRTCLRRDVYHIEQTRRLVERVHSERPIAFIHAHSPLQASGALKAVEGSERQAHIFRRQDSIPRFGTTPTGVVTRSNVPTVYCVHSPFDDELAARDRWRWPGLRTMAMHAARRTEYQNLTRSRIVQTDSHYTRRVLLERYEVPAERITALPGWVDTEFFTPESSAPAMRARLGGGDADTPCVFLTVRRLEHRMGLDTLVEAAQKLRSRGRSFALAIGGTGSLAGWLEREVERRRLSDCVRLLGRIPHRDLPSVYASADCFVLPTRALECFGLIVLEAFACGIPVIASSVAAIPELAGVQGESWLFPPGDASALADRMEAFLDGRLRISQDLRRFALEYRRGIVCGRWLELVRDVCAGGQSGLAAAEAVTGK